ncbi:MULTISPECIES: hypothetical protein [unclassified Streptomyces]|uniref:hypothetical protein n=1 Tax=unclassified Streptomyces TaxID=2593676 RepID=UPI00093B96C8|nr:hypothetical protein [Streptomyces sp. TSRI0281]OKI38394.1 hypothetical protein A6A29_10540 [Streptomyces sp. TSRI0281]
MIKRIAVVAAAAAGLVLANAGWAVAGSDGYGRDGGNPAVVCAVGGDAGVANVCGNTNIYNPNILGSLLNLLSPPPSTGGGGNNGGGGGGNN